MASNPASWRRPSTDRSIRASLRTGNTNVATLTLANGHSSNAGLSSAHRHRACIRAPPDDRCPHAQRVVLVLEEVATRACPPATLTLFASRFAPAQSDACAMFRSSKRVTALRWARVSWDVPVSMGHSANTCALPRVPYAARLCPLGFGELPGLGWLLVRHRPLVPALSLSRLDMICTRTRTRRD